MNKSKLASKLLGKGYRQLGRNFYVKIVRKANWYFGYGVVLTQHGAVQVKAAEHIPASVVDAVATQLPALDKQAKVAGFGDPDEVGAFGDWARRRSRGFRKAVGKMGRGFRRKVNKTAKAIARAKIVKTLQQAKVKALQSPVFSGAMKAGAQAMVAFGVPPNVAEAAMEQARLAAIDRNKHGGWAGLIERGSTGPRGFRGVTREIARRQARAAAQALPTLIPGGREAMNANAALRRAFAGA